MKKRNTNYSVKIYVNRRVGQRPYHISSCEFVFTYGSNGQFKTYKDAYAHALKGVNTLKYEDYSEISIWKYPAAKREWLQSNPDSYFSADLNKEELLKIFTE